MRRRAKRFTGLFAAALVAVPPGSGPLRAGEGNRTISFYHIHTQESLTVTYKRDGKYDQDALKKIDWLMRDWRENEAIKTDPETIDIIWEMHEELGSREPVHVICGFRSRGTNNMLRKTRGGQASNSQHITGKAIDIHFPDVPLHQMRYSAMIRERGGVGYYPTSGIPFIHVDTSRVRHWPRMPRDELALVFKNGHSKHVPTDGRPITPRDVEVARGRNKDLAARVAAFYDTRGAPKATLVAEAEPAPPALIAPAPKPVQRPVLAALDRMAAGAPAPSPAAVQREAAPKLVSAPKLVERSSRFTPGPSAADKKKLEDLVTLAALEPAPRLLKAPQPAKRPAPRTEAANLDAAVQSADREASAGVAAETGADNLDRLAFAADWSAAPEFDEDHPEELSYRPFPLAPFMTASASPDDPALATMSHPDTGRTLDLLDDAGEIMPMKFRPGRQVARLMWAQEFRGEAVGLAELSGREGESPAPSPVAERAVKTVSR